MIYPYKGYDRHQQRYSGKQSEQLFFRPFFSGPAALFQMMVEGGHFKDALAVGELEIRDLNDVGERLDDKEEAQRDQDQGHVEGEGKRRDRTWRG